MLPLAVVTDPPALFSVIREPDDLELDAEISESQGETLEKLIRVVQPVDAVSE